MNYSLGYGNSGDWIADPGFGLPWSREAELAEIVADQGMSSHIMRELDGGGLADGRFRAISNAYLTGKMPVNFDRADMMGQHPRGDYGWDSAWDDIVARSQIPVASEIELLSQPFDFMQLVFSFPSFRTNVCVVVLGDEDRVKLAGISKMPSADISDQWSLARATHQHRNLVVEGYDPRVGNPSQHKSQAIIRAEANYPSFDGRLFVLSDIFPAVRLFNDDELPWANGPISTVFYLRKILLGNIKSVDVSKFKKTRTNYLFEESKRFIWK